MLSFQYFTKIKYIIYYYILHVKFLVLLKYIIIYNKVKPKYFSIILL